MRPGTGRESNKGSLRRARLGDLDQLCRLERESFSPIEAFTRRRIRRLLANPRAVCRVLMFGGRIAGSSILLVRRAGRVVTGRLYSVAVARAFRRRGLAKRLVGDVLASCRRRGIGRLRLEVRADNAPAVGLYRGFGFEWKAPLPHYYARGVHAVKMALDLSPCAK